MRLRDILAEPIRNFGLAHSKADVYVRVNVLHTATGAISESLPSYRPQHAEGNARALRVGADLLEPLAAPAWTTVAAPA